jgi:hypothetical protein
MRAISHAVILERKAKPLLERDVLLKRLCSMA